MSIEYDMYIAEHKANVKKGYDWLCEKGFMFLNNCSYDVGHQICDLHDDSKMSVEEYEPYDRYFYGRGRSFGVVNDFNKAWLHHIHNNPHHWQHWVLINDDPKLGNTCIEMPMDYIVEMICDWWAFSWAKDNLYEIFDWYEEHKGYIELHAKTRKIVEGILNRIKEQLLKDDGGATK